MGKQETDDSSSESINTGGSGVAAELYADGEKYLSRKGGDSTASSSTAPKYMTVDRATRVSTASSRSHDKLSWINSKLKKIAQ